MKDRNSSAIFLGGPGYKEQAVYDAEDMTDELVEGAPGSLAARAGDMPAEGVDRRAVMVVHGRNESARQAMFDFLRALGLRPLEWCALIAGTQKAAPYVGEILEHAFRAAAAVVVLFTPDDEARLRELFWTDGDPPHEIALTPQARPNVLFEAGMALGVHPDRTVLVEHGHLRPFSDVYGRHVVRLDGSDRPLRDIARRLERAGCEVDMSGDDWARPARFPPPEATASSPAPGPSQRGIVGEVQDLNEDARRWLQDRDDELRRQYAARSAQIRAAGLEHGGARLAALAELRRQALHEYRDEITRKRRRYRQLCDAARPNVSLPRFALEPDSREVLARWRAPISVPGSDDEVEVDDPTDPSREPDLRRFEERGDGPEDE